MSTIEPIFESAEPTARGFRLRVSRYDLGVAVVVLQRTLQLNAGKPMLNDWWVRGEFLVYYPIGIDELERTLAHVCAFYDADLRTHLAEAIRKAADLPSIPLPPPPTTPPPRGSPAAN